MSYSPTTYSVHLSYDGSDVVLPNLKSVSKNKADGAILLARCMHTPYNIKMVNDATGVVENSVAPKSISPVRYKGAL
jgi:hypothetical protein